MRLLDKNLKDCDTSLLCDSAITDISTIPNISTKIYNIDSGCIASIDYANSSSFANKIYLTNKLLTTLRQFNIHMIMPHHTGHEIIIFSNIFNNKNGCNIISPDSVVIGHSDEVINKSQHMPYQNTTVHSWYYVNKNVYKYNQTLKNWNIDSFSISFINNGDSFLTYDNCCFKCKVASYAGVLFPIFSNSKLVCEHLKICDNLNKYDNKIFHGLELDSDLISFENTTGTTHYFALKKKSNIAGLCELFEVMVSGSYSNIKNLIHARNTKHYKIFSTNISSEFVVIMCEIEKLIDGSFASLYNQSQKSSEEYLIKTLSDYVNTVSRAYC